jgi:hypothetical protein
MASLDKSTIESLKKELSTAAKIVLKGDENYKDSIKRWSAAAEKEAVSHSIKFSIPLSSRPGVLWHACGRFCLRLILPFNTVKIWSSRFSIWVHVMLLGQISSYVVTGQQLVGCSVYLSRLPHDMCPNLHYLQANFRLIRLP